MQLPTIQEPTPEQQYLRKMVRQSEAVFYELDARYRSSYNDFWFGTELGEGTAGLQARAAALGDALPAFIARHAAAGAFLSDMAEAHNIIQFTQLPLLTIPE